MLGKRDYTIDVFRLLGALSVVTLHTPITEYPDAVLILLRLLCRWAVPFFFIVSGFFFAKNFEANGNIQFLRVLKNLIAIYLAANLVYFILLLFTDPGYLGSISFVQFNTGLSVHLWFISSLIFGYLILWFLLSHGLEEVLKWLALAVFVIFFIVNPYAGFFGIELDHDFTRHFLSIPFIIFGFLFSKKGMQHKYQGKLLPITLIIIGMVMQSGEAFLLYKLTGYSPYTQEFLIGTLLFATGMFLITFKINMPVENAFSQNGRKYSLFIYLYHPLINVVIFHFIYKLGKASGYFLMAGPIVSFGSTLLFAVLLDKYFHKGYKIMNGA